MGRAPIPIKSDPYRWGASSNQVQDKLACGPPFVLMVGWSHLLNHMMHMQPLPDDQNRDDPIYMMGFIGYSSLSITHTPFCKHLSHGTWRGPRSRDRSSKPAPSTQHPHNLRKSHGLPPPWGSRKTSPSSILWSMHSELTAKTQSMVGRSRSKLWSLFPRIMSSDKPLTF